MSTSSNLNAIKSAMATLDKRLEELNAELIPLNQKMGELQALQTALRNAPIRMSDFGQYLMQSIQRNGSNVAMSWARECAVEYRGRESYSKTSWSRFERDKEQDNHRFIVSGAAEATSAFALMCFLIPEVVHGKLMERLQEVVGEKKWGNLEHPTIEDREKQIAEIDAQLQPLYARHEELRTEIREIETAFSR